MMKKFENLIKNLNENNFDFEKFADSRIFYRGYRPKPRNSDTPKFRHPETPQPRYPATPIPRNPATPKLPAKTVQQRKTRPNF